MDDQVQIIESHSWRVKEIRGHAARRALQHGGKVYKADGLAPEFPRGATPQDYIFDRTRILRGFESSSRLILTLR